MCHSPSALLASQCFHIILLFLLLLWVAVLYENMTICMCIVLQFAWYTTKYKTVKVVLNERLNAWTKCC